MTTAVVLLLAFLAGGVSSIQVQGDSLCPTATEVAALLPDLLPATETPYSGLASIDASGSDLVIELRSASGGLVFSRRLASTGTCADLATIAAVVIASWTAESDPGISLLQPGVPVARPASPAAPSPALASVSAASASASPERRRGFDLSAGLGGSANSAGFVGAARVEAGLTGRRLGLRAGFAAETQRDQTIAAGTVSWRRYELALGPTLALVKRRVVVDARAELYAGFTRIAGHGFDVDHQSSAVAPGLALALRLAFSTGRVRPWIEVGGQYWLAEQRIVITRQQEPPNPNAALPRWEGRLFAGISIMLSQ